MKVPLAATAIVRDYTQVLDDEGDPLSQLSDEVVEQLGAKCGGNPAIAEPVGLPCQGVLIAVPEELGEPLEPNVMASLQADTDEARDRVYKEMIRGLGTKQQTLVAHLAAISLICDNRMPPNSTEGVLMKIAEELETELNIADWRLRGLWELMDCIVLTPTGCVFAVEPNGVLGGLSTMGGRNLAMFRFQHRVSQLTCNRTAMIGCGWQRKRSSSFWELTQRRSGGAVA